MIEIETLTLEAESRLPETLAFLKEVVDVNSHKLNHPGLKRTMDIFAERFVAMGFAAEWIDSDSDDIGKHLFLTRHGNAAGKPGVIILGHADTVFTEETEAKYDFKWRREGDKIYGPGTCDMKGGLVLAWFTLCLIQKFNPELFDAITWKVMIDACEEGGMHNFCKKAIARIEKSDIAALNFEPSGIKFNQDGTCKSFDGVRSRKGNSNVTIHTDGRSAHAGASHQNGASAIVEMAHNVAEVAALTDYEKNLTVNIGTFTGGTETNVVPAEAEVKLEIRAFDPQAMSECIDKIKALENSSLVASHADGFKCRNTVSIISELPPMIQNDGTDAFLDIWSGCAAKLNVEIEKVDRGGLSHTNYFFDKLPTVDALGICGKHVHCAAQGEGLEQEHIFVSAIVPKVVLNCMAICELLQDTPIEMHECSCQESA